MQMYIKYFEGKAGMSYITPLIDYYKPFWRTIKKPMKQNSHLSDTRQHQQPKQNMQMYIKYFEGKAGMSYITPLIDYYKPFWRTIKKPMKQNSQLPWKLKGKKHIPFDDDKGSHQIQGCAKIMTNEAITQH